MPLPKPGIYRISPTGSNLVAASHSHKANNGVKLFSSHAEMQHWNVSRADEDSDTYFLRLIGPRSVFASARLVAPEPDVAVDSDEQRWRLVSDSGGILIETNELPGDPKWHVSSTPEEGESVKLLPPLPDAPTTRWQFIPVN